MQQPERFDPDTGQMVPVPLFTPGCVYLTPGCRPAAVALVLALEAVDIHDERTWVRRTELASEPLNAADWAMLQSLTDADMKAVSAGLEHRLNVLAELHRWRIAKRQSLDLDEIDGSLAPVEGPSPLPARVAALRARHQQVAKRLNELLHKPGDGPEGVLDDEESREWRALVPEYDEIMAQLARFEDEAGL